MEYYQRNGRALQLEGLENARNKVTLGFKCDASTKIQLAQEASQYEMTLSEYVDTVIATRHQSKAVTGTENTSKLLAQLEKERLKSRQLGASLNYYEYNPILQDLLKNYQGQTQHYTDSFGQVKTITIKNVADIFAIVINSFQTNKP